MTAISRLLKVGASKDIRSSVIHRYRRISTERAPATRACIRV